MTKTKHKQHKHTPDPLDIREVAEVALVIVQELKTLANEKSRSAALALVNKAFDIYEW